MKRILYITCLIAVLFILTACRQNQATEIPENALTDETLQEEIDGQGEMTLQSLQLMINDKREELVSDLAIEDFIYKADEADFTAEEVSMLLKPRSFDYKTITLDEALEDVDYLFRIFKLQYGGYTLFGGDQAFDKARDRIEESLSSYEKISTDQLESLLIEELSFINDGHMRLGRQGINDAYEMKYYANESMAFLKDDMGYYLKEDKRYLKAIDGQSALENFLKLSLDEDGNFVYYIGGLFKEETATFKLDVTYDDQVSEQVSLIRSSELSNRKMKTYEEEIINGIPVISIRRFYDLEDEIELKSFVESGKTYKDEDILILDIRGNSGGNSTWLELWFNNYTGKRPQSGVKRVTRYSAIYRKFVSDYKASMQVDLFDKYDMPELSELLHTYLESIDAGISSDEMTYLVEEDPYERIQTDHTIFVLMDKAVASSGEDFIMKLKTLDNVVLLGTNTSGCMDISNNLQLFLPNSDLLVFLGVGLEMQASPPHFYDGHGIEPDIWIANHKVLDKVLKLIENKND